MADNQLTFLLPGAPGIAAQLSVQLIGNTGEPVGTPLAVTESGVGGYYRATMAGAAGVYGAVLLYAGDTPIALDAKREFRWDGTEIEPGFTSSDRATLTSADAAARALADGRFVIDYANSTATQYDADGTVRTVFDLVEADGTTPATTAQSAVDRVPQ